MSLKFEIGQSSLVGPRERNEDYVGVVTPINEQLSIKGSLIAVADGVSGNAGGGEASEMTIRNISTDYFATPDTWEPSTALDKVITAANRWLISQANANRDLAGMATTLSLIILRGQRYYLAHVGDTRIYLLRNNVLTQLTTDHVWDRPDMRHVLKRAVGLDAHLSVDLAEGALQVGDIFALMTDGVWETLGEKSIHEGLKKFNNVQMIAEHLTKTALHQQSADNSTAVIVKITAVGEDTLTERIAGGKHLTLPPKLNVNESIDGFIVEDILHESRASLLYKVRQNSTKQLFVLKTLQPALNSDIESCNGLLNEEWLGKRVVSQYIPQVLTLSIENRSKLYFVMSWHEGATLQQRLDHGHYFTVAGTAKIGMDITRGIGALHRLNIIHRDIKPANILMDEGGHRVMLSDFGLARVLDDASMTASGMVAGTPNYMSPEQARGESVDARSDLYSLGAVLYTMATGHPPVRGDSPLAVLRRVTEDKPRAVHGVNEAMPAWLDRLIGRFLAKSSERRIATAEEAAELLRGCLAHVRAPSRLALPSQISRQSRWLKTHAAAAIAACALFAVYFTIQGLTENAHQRLRDPSASSSNNRRSPPLAGFGDERWSSDVQRIADSIQALKQELSDDFFINPPSLPGEPALETGTPQGRQNAN